MARRDLVVTAPGEGGDHAMIPDLERSIDELGRKLDQLRVYL